MSKIHHLLVATGVLLAQSWLASPEAAAQAARTTTSDAKDRQEVSITVYNQNFGLVREVRQLDLGTGRVALDFQDVAANIEPQTVAIKSLAGGGGLQVLEQT